MAWGLGLRLEQGLGLDLELGPKLGLMMDLDLELGLNLDLGLHKRAPGNKRKKRKRISACLGWPLAVSLLKASAWA